MELTGLQIFKYLPGAKKAEGTNCKKCGCPTCMAYALKLAKKQTDIEKCPHIPDELKEKFSESSKIQQHEIKLSDELVTGGETVMFRHDKTAMAPPAELCHSLYPGDAAWRQWHSALAEKPYSFLQSFDVQSRSRYSRHRRWFPRTTKHPSSKRVNFFQ